MSFSIEGITASLSSGPIAAGGLSPLGPVAIIILSVPPYLGTTTPDLEDSLKERLSGAWQPAINKKDMTKIVSNQTGKRPMQVLPHSFWIEYSFFNIVPLIQFVNDFPKMI
jgi:hypothetical protein